MTRRTLQITQDADQDLDDLYAYGFVTWGEAQADRYYDGLTTRLGQLCNQPFLYPAVDHIRAGYRRSIYKKHAVFYIVTDDAVEIRAVIRHQDLGSRD